MKYNHHFKLIETNKYYVIFKSEANIIRLDFLNNILRVAMYKENDFLFPTYSISPGNYKIDRYGRDKLSTDKFDLIDSNYKLIDDIFSFKINDVSISINLVNFHMTYKLNDKVLFEDREYISYNFEGELGKGVSHYISREKDEKIYGLGDKSGNINKTNRHFKLETSDSMGYDGNTSDPLYKQIPFYICSNSIGNYGIFYDTYCNGEFDFGLEINNYYGPYKYFKCEDTSLVFYVFFGEVSDIVRNFAYMQGKSLMAPKWALKYCGSTMSYTDSKDADNKLRGFIDLSKKYGISPGGFYMSSGYTSIGNKRYVFNWNKDKIKDPSDLAKFYKDNNVELICNVKPAFLDDHFLYDYIASKGWFLHYKDGTPAKFPFWGGFGSYLDFTNDEAFDFWSSLVKEKLVDLGFLNIWNDNNEYDIHDEDVYACGFGHEIQAIKIRPLFSYLMSLASLKATKGNSLSVCRSGIAGLSKVAYTWTGDNRTSFEDFRANHKIAMTMSLSGQYYFGQDIGGFEGDKPDELLFIRWLQYGVFTPRFTLHSWNNDGSSTMPWLYEQKMDIVKKIFDLREKLIPYLYNTLYQSVNNYTPMIYPIFLKHKDYDIESDYFYVGDSIIACPIFDKDNNLVSIDLPNNNGGYYFNNKYYEGHVEIVNTINDLPVYFIKGGSVIPITDNSFEIYPLDIGTFKYEFVDENTKPISIQVICNESFIQIISDYSIKYKVIDRLNRTIK